MNLSAVTGGGSCRCSPILSPTIQDVDDTERPVAFVRAELAMIGMRDAKTRASTAASRAAGARLAANSRLNAAEARRQWRSAGRPAGCLSRRVNAQECPRISRAASIKPGYEGMSVQRGPHFESVVASTAKLSEPPSRPRCRMNAVSSRMGESQAVLDRRQCQFCKLTSSSGTRRLHDRTWSDDTFPSATSPCARTSRCRQGELNDAQQWHRSAHGLR